MVYFKIVDAKDGKKVKQYYLTQGDTFQNQLDVLNNSGEVVSQSLILSVLFKLSDSEYNFEYSKEYEFNGELNKWELTISSEDTSKFAIGTHIYEYQITYVNGIVSTPVQAKFIVTDQIRGDNK
jgi:hypothetical protein